MKELLLFFAFVGIFSFDTTTQNGASVQLRGYNDASVTPTPDVVSVKSGYWDDATTWSPAIVPDSTKIVEVYAGHTVTLRSDVSCKDLVLHGTNAFSGNYRIYIKGH